MVVLLAIVAVVLLASSGPAQAAPAAAPPALQQALDRLVADGVPGAIALERAGGQEWHAAAGVENLATRKPISPYDRFRVGSITKSFVSTVVLQLAAAGRLSLDDTVERWLPGLVPDGGAITLRELMNHTSGIADYIDLPFYLQILHDPLKVYRPLDLVRRATSKPRLFPPGTSFTYSNTDYILLGMVIAAVDRIPPPLASPAPVLETYRRVIAPLGLWNTSWPIGDPGIAGPHAHGYVIDPPPDSGLPPVLDTTLGSPTWAWSAGAVISTLDDIADFHHALFTGRLLAPAQQRELQTTVPVAPGLDYGLGVFKLQTPCGPAWGHDGGTPSSVTISLTSPDGTRQAVLLATRDANTWTTQIDIDYSTAIVADYCGALSPAAAARPLAAPLSGILPSLQPPR
jgi:D-alanyl-D-alanine carboxypeptidase